MSKRLLAIVFVVLCSYPVTGAAQSRAAGEVTCRRIESGSGAPCSANEYLLRRLADDGLHAALAALDTLGRNDPEVRRHGHAYAHAIGIAAYSGRERVGDIFSQCTPIFQSGCYHGVIQAYFQASGHQLGQELEAAVVDGLCQDMRADPGLRWQLFQCAHGLGHGVMMAMGNHVPRALAACDLVADPWEREACYGAVFMENLVQATSTDGSIGRPGGAHAHVNTPAGAAPFPPFDRDDPLYPCSVVGDRYLEACYQMQTSVILYLNGYDVRAAAANCPTAPEPFRSTCFQSLGRDISAITVQDHRDAIRLCGHAPAEYRPFCHIGYTKNLIDLTADPGDGFAYCRLLDEPASKRACYIAVGEQIWVIEPAGAARRMACEAAEAGYAEACRLGAGVGENAAGARRE